MQTISAQQVPVEATAGEGAPPVPMPQIRIGHRGQKQTMSSLSQIRNPPEPFVHEFQPKTPERDIASSSEALDAAYIDSQYQQGHLQSDHIQYHSQGFQQGSYTPRNSYMEASGLQHIIQDPTMLQQQHQLNLQQQYMQQQQMYNPLQHAAMMTPTHGLGMPRRAAAGFGGASRSRTNNRTSNMNPWLQDPLHDVIQEERERKREMKLLKNREAAR
jgi:hypothetical protein